MMAAYGTGQRNFGENYVQELVDKGPQLPEDTRLHFIGHLQTNKVKQLVSEPRLVCVHTVVRAQARIERALSVYWRARTPPSPLRRVRDLFCCHVRLGEQDSVKLATELQKRSGQLRPDRPLDVMAQVNTSAEASKGGCAPDDVAALCLSIRESCPALRLIGLMCIGKYSKAEGGSGEDFTCLVECRNAAAKALGVAPEDLHLSMGMSHDFEEAIVAGATFVRVGSTIFGARPAKTAAAAPSPPGMESLSIADGTLPSTAQEGGK